MRPSLASRAAGALLVICIGSAAAPAAALQILDAADGAELAGEIAAGAVSRIALEGDRIARVVRGAEGFEAEHDPATGDLYLRPLGDAAAPPDMEERGDAAPVTLFIGTEKGFTYRLALAVVERGSAQILIRNRAAAAAPDETQALAGNGRVAALVALVRSVARREPLEGYAIAVMGGVDAPAPGPAVVEVWRGPGFEAHVVEAGDTPDAAVLAARFAGAAAAWLGAPGTAPSGGRLAVVVTERAGAEGPR